MTEHLTEQQIESFRCRKMSPEGLRAAHRHIAVCEMCRARLSTPGQVAFAAAALEREIQQADAEDDHLRYQELSGYVDDALREIEREIVESHLETCADCAAEVRDLRNFKSIITAKESDSIELPSRSERSRARWNLWARWNPVQRAVAATGIILLLTGAFFLLRSKIFHQDRTQLVQAPQPVDEATQQKLPVLPSPTALPQMKPGDEPIKPSNINQVRPSTQPGKGLRRRLAEGETTPSTQIIVALKDGDRTVTLDSRGYISGVAAGVPGVQRMLAGTLRSQRLEKPPALDRLIRGSSTQLDIGGESSSFSLERPVGTVIQSDRPTFIWRPLDGASSYIVSVFDAQLNEVARSERLTTTAWSSPRALQRGAIYRWQVIAVKDGREVLLPSPTAPEAKFKVLEQQKARELTSARRRYANSHLTLGVLYAQEGLLDEAETELQALVKDNPASTVARKLLESLQAWRKTQRKPPENRVDSRRQEP